MKSPRYKSSIPVTAKELVVERQANGVKRKAEYRLGRKLVGIRFFFETGEPELQYGLKDGKKHGIKFDWYGPGMLMSAEPFVDGIMHGTTRQWDHQGRLIGTYRMVRGTGIDLWRAWRNDGTPYLSEILRCKDGHRHGFEWWINEDQKTVYIERHWHNGYQHGIERHWNRHGRLSSGFPKYHVNGNVIARRQYLKASASDPTLPPFRSQDNHPARTFPPEIARHLPP